ncbi:MULTISPECIES: c-type cytochrome [unclassified Nitrospina]|uniref:c-type cytochrome n=1 Tax=unclassified Nitrospina TaxID=2638683 RepID=UPI003F98CC03
MNRNGMLTVLVIGSLLVLGRGDVQAENVPETGICPQVRKTLSAPGEFLKRKNPLRKEPRHLKRGKVLALIKAKPLACKQCHGMKGNGMGAMAPNMDPKPRNFTCKMTMDTISDGQLFWIIRNGSKGTSMPAYSHLSDERIWQIIHYIRSLSVKKNEVPE